jgi:hypothetical protein
VAVLGLGCSQLPPPAESPREPVRIPIELGSGIPFLPVRIDASGPFWFALDSGFQNSAVDWAIAERLGLEIGPEQTVAAPGGSVQRATITGVRFTVGPVEVRDPTVSAVRDLDGLAPLVGHRIDGILGFDFLSRFAVTIDYAGRAVELVEPELFRPPAGSQPIALDLGPRQPYVAARVQSARGEWIEGRFLIDTGAVTAVTLNTPFSDAHHLAEGGPSLRVRGRSIGGDTDALLLRLPALRLGDVTLPGPVAGVTFDDVDRAGQISGEALSRFRLTFDYSRERMFLEPGPHLGDPFELDMAGFFLIAGGPDLRERTVYWVLEDTPAAEAGIRAGDRLLEVDGRDARGLALEAVRALFQQAAATRSLVLERDGETLRVTIRLRRLI